MTTPVEGTVESGGDGEGSGPSGTTTTRPKRSPVPLSWPQRVLHPTVAGALGFGFALWGFWLGVRPLSDNSFFTHLATGRLILENHAIPTTDPYSFTATGQPWVVQSWLASVLYALTDSWFGAAGLRVLTGVLVATVVWLAWRLARPANLVIRFALVALLVVVGGAMWSPRPLIIGLVLLGLTLLAAEARLDPRWLVPTFWLWVNCHGSFPLGLVALGVLYLGRRLDKDDPNVEWRALKWAALGTVLGAINPLGPKLLIFPVELLQKSDSLQQIIEWKSPDFLLGWTKVFLLQVVVAILALVRRPSWRLALPTVVFLAASLLGQRNIAVASLVLVLVTARGLAGIGNLTGKDRSVVFAVAGAVIAVVVAAASLASFDRPNYDVSTFPAAAVAWLDAKDAIARPGVAVATSDTTGNYLELLYGADARAYMDDRVDMYPKQTVDDLVTLIGGKRGWRTALDDSKVDVVLWDRGGPLPELLATSDDWRVVYQDEHSVVACRRGTTTGSLVCGA